jgi:glycosyltransferase involved in cell wall biosynthesis
MISIVIPVYNEELAIRDDLRDVISAMDASKKDYEVLVVDDGSTDRTRDIVREFPQVRLIEHGYNRGTGAARTTGLLQSRGDIVAMTDGDGTYPNRDMPRLVDALEGYDMVIGARKREAGTLRLLRTPAKSFIRGLASYLCGRKIPDLNSGMRVVRKDAALRFLNILPTTHSWVSTITIALLSNGYGVNFLPIDYFPRKGRSSFHPFRDTYNYLSLVVRTILYFNPLKVFLPASVILLGVGCVKLIYDIIAYNWHFAPSTVTLLLTGIQIGALGMLADLIVRKMGAPSSGPPR